MCVENLNNEGPVEGPNQTIETTGPDPNHDIAVTNNKVTSGPPPRGTDLLSHTIDLSAYADIESLCPSPTLIDWHIFRLLRTYNCTIYVRKERSSETLQNDDIVVAIPRPSAAMQLAVYTWLVLRAPEVCRGKCIDPEKIDTLTAPTIVLLPISITDPKQ